jgi:hypothetical protein
MREVKRTGYEVKVFCERNKRELLDGTASRMRAGGRRKMHSLLEVSS